MTTTTMGHTTCFENAASQAPECHRDVMHRYGTQYLSRIAIRIHGAASPPTPN
jgi:hypothetical protein